MGWKLPHTKFTVLIKPDLRQYSHLDYKHYHKKCILLTKDCSAMEQNTWKSDIMEVRLPWSTSKEAGVYILGPVLSRERAGQTTSISNHKKHRQHLVDRKETGGRKKEHSQLVGEAFRHCGHGTQHVHFQPGWPWHNYLAGKIDWPGYSCCLLNPCWDSPSLPNWAGSLRDQERPRLLPSLRSPSYLKMKKCQNKVINMVVYLSRYIE